MKYSCLDFNTYKSREAQDVDKAITLLLAVTDPASTVEKRFYADEDNRAAQKVARRLKKLNNQV